MKIAAIIVAAVAPLLLAEAKPMVPNCVTDEDRVLIRRLLLEAVNDALRDHMKALFTGWIKDPTNQPQRASAGLQSAIAAYQRARHDAVRWSPKSCDEDIHK